MAKELVFCVPSLSFFFFSLKVFDVVINNHFTVASNLDIFAQVGRAVAYDLIVPFAVRDGQLIINDETSDFDGTLVVEFSKVRKAPQKGREGFLSCVRKGRSKGGS